MGRVYDNAGDEVARELEYRSHEHANDAANMQRLIDARGDCSIVPGWSGKMPITMCRKLLVEHESKSNAYRAAAEILREALRQVEARTK